MIGNMNDCTHRRAGSTDRAPLKRAGAAIAIASLCTVARAHIPASQQVLAPDGVAGDHFGRSTAIHLDTLAVGAPGRDENGSGSGAAYVFARVGPTTWAFQDKVLASDGVALDAFGHSIAVEGDTMVVGAPGNLDLPSISGYAYVFTRTGSAWTEQQKLVPSDGAPGFLFGRQVALSGNTVVVAAPGNEAAYVYVESGGTWIEEAILNASDGSVGDAFGFAVSIHDDQILVGSPGHDAPGLDAGAAYLFDRSGTVWTETLRFEADDPQPGDGFGRSVGIDTTYVGIGAPFDDDQGTDAGALHAFERSGTSWISHGTLVSGFAPAGPGDHLGETVDVDDKILTFGQPFSDLQGTNSGGAQVFEWFPVVQPPHFQGDVLFPSGVGKNDGLGVSVGVSRCWFVAGAWRSDDLGADSGAVYMFRWTHPGLTTSYCTAGTSALGCQATLSASGSASASLPSGFSIDAAGAESQKGGIFFFGANGRQANTWGTSSSFQCVVPPVYRTPLQTGTGTPNECDGGYTIDLNALWCPTCPKPSKNPGSGVLVQAQLWYRDPLSTSNQSTALSDAIEFYVCP